MEALVDRSRLRWVTWLAVVAACALSASEASAQTTYPPEDAAYPFTKVATVSSTGLKPVGTGDLDGDGFAELAPDYLVPCHCTGWKAIHALAGRFPEAYLPNAVGTRFEFRAAG